MKKTSKMPIYLGALIGLLWATLTVWAKIYLGKAELDAYWLGVITGGALWGWLIGTVWYVIAWIINHQKAKRSQEPAKG